MKKYLILLLIFAFAIGAFAQKDDKAKKNEKETKTATVKISKNSTPMELAKAALQAHGGDKFKLMKSSIVRGTAKVSGSPTQVFDGTFVTVLAGEKYSLEINTPFRSFKQVHDGEQTTSSIPGIMLPPLNRLGLPLLPKIDEKGYTVAALPEKSNKLGFRITSPEDYYTDFYLDEKTGQVKSYASSYIFEEQNVTTAVEIDKFREVDGIFIPERFAQRIEIGQITVYVDFKATEILVNSTVADDVFTMK